MSERIEGTVSRVLLLRGFGFIKDGYGRDYFMHADQCKGFEWSGATVHEGVKVTFVPEKNGDRGNGLRATEVQLA